MFPSIQYARVMPEDDIDDDGRGLLAQAAAPPPPPVNPTVLTSSSAQLGPSHQGVMQRKGSSLARVNDATAAGRSGAGLAGSSGNLIDFGDDSDPRPAPAVGKAAAKGGKGGPQQVELVTMQPTDPFDFLAQSSAQPNEAATGRTASHAAASTSGQGSGIAGSFKLFGSLTDLFGAGTAASAAAAPAGAAGGAAAAGRGHGGGQGPGVAPAEADALVSFSALAGRPAAGAAAAPPGGSVALSAQHHRHSQSSNGIDDLLQMQHQRREAEAMGGGALHAPGHVRTAQGAGGHPGSSSAAEDVFDPFGMGASVPVTPAPMGVTPSPTAAGAAGGTGAGAGGAGAGAEAGPSQRDDDSSGTGLGQPMSNRELHLWAVPLFKDRLVFLPVVNWTDEPDTSTVMGKVNAGLGSVGTSISNYWHGLKDKGNFGEKIYKAGQAILENMNAEERLMRNIPKKANKLVVHHPASIPPDEIQDQLTALTSTFCYKSAGKAAVATVMLPVAVGLEVIAVPGIGWYTAYVLFKSTSAAAGGSRLNQYLNQDKRDVRVCYVGEPKLDIYILKSRLAPDSVLGSEDIEDLLHDIHEPLLSHPLQELRQRFLKKSQTTKEDYALLPMNAPDQDEAFGNNPNDNSKKKA